MAPKAGRTAKKRPAGRTAQTTNIKTSAAPTTATKAKTKEAFVLKQFIDKIMHLGGYKFTAKAKLDVLRLASDCSGTNAARHTLEVYLGQNHVVEVLNTENKRAAVTFQTNNFTQACCLLQDCKEAAEQEQAACWHHEDICTIPRVAEDLYISGFACCQNSPQFTGRYSHSTAPGSVSYLC